MHGDYDIEVMIDAIPITAEITRAPTATFKAVLDA